MTRIAHLSDMHLNGSPKRYARFARALGAAMDAGVDHLILTGDLTASGAPESFVELSRSLRAWPSEAVTIVPGNHDGTPEMWCCALGGPLRRFAATSGRGNVTSLGDSVVVPINTQIPNPAPMFQARGYVKIGDLVHLHDVASQARGKPVVVAAHHGPQTDPIQFIMGLTNQSQVDYVLEKNPSIVWCCGHDHRALDLGRVYAAASVATHTDPIRLYEVRGRRLVPTYRSRDTGSYL